MHTSTTRRRRDTTRPRRPAPLLRDGSARRAIIITTTITPVTAVALLLAPLLLRWPQQRVLGGPAANPPRRPRTRAPAHSSTRFLPTAHPATTGLSRRFARRLRLTGMRTTRGTEPNAVRNRGRLAGRKATPGCHCTYICPRGDLPEGTERDTHNRISTALTRA